MSHNENLRRIDTVKNALGELKGNVVFVGGSTVSLYADRRSEEIRPTDDIDIIIEVLAYKDYAVIDEKLRKMGFVNDKDSGIICRYIINGVIVDIMPIHDSVLGFSNKWYPAGFANSIEYDFGDDTIRIFSSAYFIASKLEAFKNRGSNDGRTSTDFEDIVFLLENCSSIWDDMDKADDEVRSYLKNTFETLLANRNFEEWIDSHAGYGSPPATYFILERLQAFITKK